jgi:tryptophan synthase
MGYYNPYAQYGDAAVVRDCAAAGVQGFILSDLPPEESVQFRQLCSAAGCAGAAPHRRSVSLSRGLTTHAHTCVSVCVCGCSLSYVPMVTPTTTDDRIATLAGLADTFLYVVSVTGLFVRLAAMGTAYIDAKDHPQG